MQIKRISTLDEETLNDCLIDLPSMAVSTEPQNSRTTEYLRHFWSTDVYKNLDLTWKGFDDNEAWAI